jgi:hypothetical protein
MAYNKNDYMVEFRQRNKRTQEGWLTKVYGRMRKSAKDRGMPMPTFTKKELWGWIDKAKFNSLFEAWCESGCKKQLVPSINRIDDYKSYTLDNIELITWAENNKKGRGSIKTWELAHSKLGDTAKAMFSKPVAKADLDGTVLCIYPSVREAARQNNADASTISKVCRGEKHTHHKHKWTYLNV